MLGLPTPNPEILNYDAVNISFHKLRAEMKKVENKKEDEVGMD